MKVFRRHILVTLPLFPWCMNAFSGSAGSRPTKPSDIDNLVPSEEEKELFIKGMETKSLTGRLKTDRFVEPVMFLLEPTSWSPNKGDNSKIRSVKVPKGFVTDLASIPKPFYSLYRPDGEYAHAAVIHDYLYWSQIRSKEESDRIFKIAMQDLDVSPSDVDILFEAVSTFGYFAWKKNQALKSQGEKRILRRFPRDDQVNVRWAEWKRDPTVFAD